MASSYSPSFQLPSIVVDFPLTYHKNGHAIAAASDKWFENGCRTLTEDKRHRFRGLKASQLAAYCYNNASDGRLRVVCDFINFLFHLDDISDGLKTKGVVMLSNIVMNALASPYSYRRILPDGSELPEEEPEASRIARDYWARCIQDAGVGFQTRYRQNIHMFFEAVESEAMSRDKGLLLGVDEYIINRRGNGCCDACFNLLEYANGIDLPNFVIEDHIIQKLMLCANDFIALSNDIFSYNVEQSRGDMSNIVTIIMKTYNLDLQDAVDRVGEMCRTALETYRQNKSQLPSWGSKIDTDVAEYIRGLEDWMAGSFHWSFMTERYFGSKHDKVKENGLVEILPQRWAHANAA